MKKVNRKLNVVKEKEWDLTEEAGKNPFTVFSRDATIAGTLRKMERETGMANDILDLDHRAGSIDILRRDGTEDLDVGERPHQMEREIFSNIT